jgi:regulator of protease activity HflC (stomatin/prohibitin superfamily)
MVQVAALGRAIGLLKSSFARLAARVLAIVVVTAVFYGACTVRVLPNEWGVEQKKFGFKRGIVDTAFGPGIYFVGPGTTMHTFPREIHVLEASFDRRESLAKAQTMGGEVARKVDQYFDRRNRLLGSATHRLIDALNIQTSDGYAVATDITLLYSIRDPVKIAREFGWGSLYVDAFVINTFRNGILATLGKLNAESFYDELVRIPAIHDSEAFLAERFKARGFKVERLLLRNFRYAENYERSLHDKKVAVQLTEKNRKESLVNEEKAKLKQIESKGNADITIAESEVKTKISKIRAEAELYASQVRAKADKEINIAGAEAKRLKADALTAGGGRYVVALETAKMFENIDGAVMTPEQYIAFVRSAWALIGVSPGGVPSPRATEKK